MPDEVSQPDPVKAAAEKKRLFNESQKLKMRQRRAKAKEIAAVRELITEAKVAVFIENEDDPRRKDQRQKLIKQGHSLEDFELYEYEVEQAFGIAIASAQATGTPSSLYFDGKTHLWYQDSYPREHRMDWWDQTGYSNQILHECDFVNDRTRLDDLADLQIQSSETAYKYRKIAVKLKAGYKTTHLLNPLWLDRDLSNRTPQLQKLTAQLKSVESYLTASGITGLWRPEDSPTDDSGRPREFESWEWTKSVSETRLPPMPNASPKVIIRPEDARTGMVEPKPYIAGLLDAQEISRVLTEKEPISSPAAIVQTVAQRTSLVDAAMKERGL